MNAPATQTGLADARRRWARQVLDLPAEHGSGDSAAAVLQRLQDAEFVPSGSWRQAMHALVSSPNTAGGVLSPHAYDSLLSFGEEALRGEVEEFAGRFFGLAPSERRERWRQLRWSAGLTPALTLRLDALAEGLDLDAQSPSGQNADQRELAELAARFSMLRPGQRAQLRRQKLAELGQDLGRWQRAAACLERDRPRLAALAPDLLRGLKEGQATQKRPAVPLFRPTPAQAASTAATGQTGGSSSRGSLWWVGVAAIVLIWIVRGVSSYTPSRSSYPGMPAPNYNPADIDRLLRQPRQPAPPDGQGESEKSRVDALIRKILRDAEERKQREGTVPSGTPSPPHPPGLPPPQELRPSESVRKMLEEFRKKQKTPVTGPSASPASPPAPPPSRPQ